MGTGDDTFMGRGMALDWKSCEGASPSAVSRMIVLTDGFTLDEADSRRVAPRAKTGSLSISTMGLGSFNEDLMMALAVRPADTAQHRIFEEIPRSSNRSSAGAVVSYRNLELKLNVSQGVELRCSCAAGDFTSGSLALRDRGASLVWATTS
jgi:hypothetical protein